MSSNNSSQDRPGHPTHDQLREAIHDSDRAQQAAISADIVAGDPLARTGAAVAPQPPIKEV